MTEAPEPAAMTGRTLSDDELGQIRELEDLILHFAPKRVPRVERHLNRGKLDWKATMRSERTGTDRVFKRTTIKRTPIAINAVLNLDLSWSTACGLDHEVSAAHVISEALESAGHQCAVVAFTGRARVVKDWDSEFPLIEPFEPRFTNIDPALRKDVELFEQANEGKRVLINLGDGEVDDDAFPRRFLFEFNESGYSLGLHFRQYSHPLGEQGVAWLRESCDLLPAMEAFLSRMVEQ